MSTLDESPWRLITVFTSEATFVKYASRIVAVLGAGRALRFGGVLRGASSVGRADDRFRVVAPDRSRAAALPMDGPRAAPGTDASRSWRRGPPAFFGHQRQVQVRNHFGAVAIALSRLLGQGALEDARNAFGDVPVLGGIGNGRVQMLFHHVDAVAARIGRTAGNQMEERGPQ